MSPGRWRNPWVTLLIYCLPKTWGKTALSDSFCRYSCQLIIMEIQRAKGQDFPEKNIPKNGKIFFSHTILYVHTFKKKMSVVCVFTHFNSSVFKRNDQCSSNNNYKYPSIFLHLLEMFAVHIFVSTWKSISLHIAFALDHSKLHCMCEPNILIRLAYICCCYAKLCHPKKE